MTEGLDLDEDRQLLGGMGALSIEGAKADISEDLHQSRMDLEGIPEFGYLILGQDMMDVSLWRVRFVRLGTRKDYRGDRITLSYEVVDCLRVTGPRGTILNDGPLDKSSFDFTLEAALERLYHIRLRALYDQTQTLRTLEGQLGRVQRALKDTHKNLRELHLMRAEEWVPSHYFGDQIKPAALGDMSIRWLAAISVANENTEDLENP